MHETKSLESQLKQHIIMNAARINFTACFIIALLKAGTVNLTKVALAFPGKASKESKYKRIQRFFAKFPLDLDMIAKLITEMIPNKIDSWVFTMDRTNWKLGKININILTIGIAYMGIAFPVMWVCLKKKGNSNTDERITLIKRLINLFSADKISCLVADREFIGQLWFSFLIDAGILFRIRIKDCYLASNSKGNMVPVKNLFRHVKCGQYTILESKRMVLGHNLYVIGSRLPSGEYMIIVTNDNPDSALDDYLKRWGIETLFGCLKTRGFNFESTHMTELERVEKLVALLAIAFVWCHIIGEWKNDQKKIKIKKHGRKAISIFRYGYDHLREILFNWIDLQIEFKKTVNMLFSNVKSDFVVVNNRNFRIKRDSKSTDIPNKMHKYIDEKGLCKILIGISVVFLSFKIFLSCT